MDDLSHLTILAPRELSFGESSRFLFSTDVVIDREQLNNRKDFCFTTLSFCLSLANLWRFPEKALLHGHGAFVWLYILFTTVLGSSLVFFEVALGQYSSKGFSKVFAMCPLFEGISYSMALYCGIVAMYYNMLNVYFFNYIADTLNTNISYKQCIINSYECVEGSDNQSKTPEHVYFYYHVVQDYRSGNDENWRNVAILFFLWVIICIAIIRGIRITKWPSRAYSPISYGVLIITLILSCTLKGSAAGIQALFIPKKSDILNPQTWESAFEQTVVALGLGMGPLITFGSYSKFKSPANKDCFVICLLAVVGSLLAGVVFFATVGVLADERNQTMASVLKDQGNYPDDLNAHVIFSQLFTRLSFGVAHLNAVIFFLMFLLAGWYSLLIYTETFVVIMYRLCPKSKKYSILVIICVCTLCFLLGSLMASMRGHNIMVALEKLIVASCLIVITFFELTAVIFIYGIFYFCDDIELMLGFYPNEYYQTTWVLSPIILLIAFGYFIRLCVLERFTNDEYYAFIAVEVIILLPTVLIAIYNSYSAHKKGNILLVLSPREVIIFENDGDMKSKSNMYLMDLGTNKGKNLKIDKVEGISKVSTMHQNEPAATPGTSKGFWSWT